MQNKKPIVLPTRWEDIPCGIYYRQSLEKELHSWWPKVFGFHLLKIGPLSADLNTENCSISKKINVGLKGQNLQVIADPHQLPFVNKSIDACLLAHTLSYSKEPYQLLLEVDRVLVHNGWLVITTFNSVSMLGLSKLFPFLFNRYQYKSRMYTQTKLLDWLDFFNFKVLHYTHLQVLPWQRYGALFLNNHFSAIGCLTVIIASKQTSSLNLRPLKKTLAPSLEDSCTICSA